MAFKDLRSFIATLEKNGEAIKIEEEVNWNLEAGAIVRRTYENKSPAPFFQKITGYPKGYRMFGGSLSNLGRMALSWGLPRGTQPRAMIDEYLKRKEHPIKPIIVKSGPCKEEIHLGKDVNLFEFPAPMVHEGDGGRYLCTWHLIIQKDLDLDWTNWGMYRAMIHTKDSLGGLLERYNHGGLIHWKYLLANQVMHFAISIGADPVSSLMSCTKVGYGISEVDIAGAIMQEPVELVKCETNDLLVPATSEIVIEGEVHPQERLFEGPFGEYTGYRASPRDKRPVYRVKAITHRKNPIVTMSCMGVPVDEAHVSVGITRSADLIVKLKQEGIPVQDIWVYPEFACFVIAVSVKTPITNIASRVASLIWGSEAGSQSPWVLVFNDDIDLHNMAQAMHALYTKCHPYRGITRLEHGQGSPLMPFLSREERLNSNGAKTYFDATWPLDWDPSVAVPPRASFNDIYSKEVQQHVIKKWKKYGFTD